MYPAVIMIIIGILNKKYIIGYQQTSWISRNRVQTIDLKKGYSNHENVLGLLTEPQTEIYNVLGLLTEPQTEIYNILGLLTEPQI